MSNNDLLNRIDEKFSKLSKGQKKIADYILNNYDKVAFMTAHKLGNNVEVSESTVVRFARALGYNGYPELQRALQESIKTKLTTVQRFNMSKDLEKSFDIYKNIMKRDIENIHKTIEELDIDVLMDVSDKIYSARRVYVLGMRSSAVLAQYLSFYLNFSIDRVNVIPVGVLDPLDSVINLTKEDLLIAITFPRYSRTTIELVEYAHEKEVPIVAITDSLSPISSISDYTLTSKYDMKTFIDSLVAPMSLLNSLILAVGIKNKDFLDNKFKELESVWKKSKTYSDKFSTKPL